MGDLWTKQAFTDEEDAIIREMYPTHTAKQISRRIPSHTQGAISIRAQTLGIKKSNSDEAPRKLLFAPEEDAIIQQYYPTHTAKEIRSQFLPGRSVGSIQGRANTLGIDKNYFSADSGLDEAPFVGAENYKQCSSCKKFKERKYFRKDRTRPDGLNPSCTKCLSVRGLGQKRNKDAPLPKEVFANGEKRCTICRELKPLEEFHVNKNARDGRWSRCRKCDNLRKVREHGITPAEYHRMLEAQKGVCACCGQNEAAADYRTGTTRRLAVDHDHKTGKVRGLLCQKCNMALGQLDEDPARVRALLRYIEECC